MQYLYPRDVCTGLGDRLGLVLTLSALASLENATVYFPWCEDPAPVIPRIRPYVPTWHGFNLSKAELQRRFSIPNNVVLDRPPHAIPTVQIEGVGLQAENGLDSVYTTAWRTMRLGRVHTLPHDFIAAYKNITLTALTRSLRPASYPPTPYIVLHLRGPDENTYIPYPGALENMYCTDKVLRALKNLPVVAISNNVTWANARFPSHPSFASEPYDDMMLLLNAHAVVQHAYNSWSSFSTVPALAKGTPLLTTHQRPSTLLTHLLSLDSWPPELYNCDHYRRFVKRVKRGIKNV